MNFNFCIRCGNAVHVGQHLQGWVCHGQGVLCSECIEKDRQGLTNNAMEQLKKKLRSSHYPPNDLGK